MDLPEINDFGTLFCADTPLLDVRAPVEFKQGAFPGSQNEPLLNDDERKQIGIRYKHEGQDAAVALGVKLISGEIKASRVSRWAQFIEAQPNAALYCFRGGMRSKIAQQWIFEETGLVVPRVKGGYKAMRRYLIDQTEHLAAHIDILILSGRTGSGKTLLIQQLAHMLDLEGLANHRGSSFGRQISPQPTQIEFENKVAIGLIKLVQRGVSKIILEDESPNIGSVHIPHALYDKMREASCVVLEAGIDQRVDITRKEYVSDMLQQYCVNLESDTAGFEAFSEYLRGSLQRVRRRLGDQRYHDILSLMEQALEQHKNQQIEMIHDEWLRQMLVEYYDPMYDYQQEKRKRKTLKAGDFEEVMVYLQQYQ